MASIPDSIDDQVADLYFRLAEQERRFANRERTGTIAEVDYERGLYRVRLGEGDGATPFLSPWLRLQETAMGAKIKTHFPLAAGEQVKVSSESGSLSDAVITQSGRSNDNTQASQKGDEALIQNDSTVIYLREGELRIKSDKIVMEGEVHLGGDGGSLVHRKGDADIAGHTAEGSASKVYAV